MTEQDQQGSDTPCDEIVIKWFSRSRLGTISSVTYSDPYVYLRAHGFFGTTGARVEEWSVGFKLLQPSGTVPTASLTAFLETVSGPIGAFHQDLNVTAGTNVFLAELTAAVVGEDGKYVGGGTQTTMHRAYTTPLPGGGAPKHDFSTAVVLSLRTTLLRGRASNGRAYWPSTAAIVDASTGVIIAGNTAGIAAAAKTMLNQINAAADSIIAGNMGIWVMSNVGAGLSAPVTAVRVGGRVDRFETREKSIVEQYSSQAVTPVTQALADEVGDEIGDLGHHRGEWVRPALRGRRG